MVREVDVKILVGWCCNRRRFFMQENKVSSGQDLRGHSVDPIGLHLIDLYTLWPSGLD